MEVLVLGEVQVWAGNRRFDVGLPRQQAVLAALLVDGPRPVPVPTLIDRVWGEAPPDGARNVLYSHVSRIRRLLRDVTVAIGVDAGRVERRSAGYVLALDPDTVDLHRFRRLVASADDPKCTDSERADVLRRALDLWRGLPLGGVPGEWAARVRESCQRQWLDATVAWADAELRLGRPGGVLAVLPDLASAHPLVEPLSAALMRALHQSGRDAEALQAYAVLRRRLADELGTEPGPDLRDLHASILRGSVPRVAPPARALPRQLPPDVSGFTGRSTELSELDGLLATSAAVVISAVSGTAGVGKTALALHWGHRVAHLFPDGQLYANLRGYDADQPVAPGDALAGFLSALGVPGPDIPFEVEDRAARYRTELVGRRLLIVLDNASTVEQVWPLLPGAPTCLVVVTSRDALPGLVARHGARRVTLDPLPPADAVSLLCALIGSRAAAAPAAAAELAERCARLPLALRVAAELAIARPDVPLSRLARELGDGPLDRLAAGGDPRTAVRSVFSWSYRHLADPVARAFRLLGLHPGPDWGTGAAAALLDRGPAETSGLLDALARAHLVQSVGGDRYAMHDLLRAYAHERAGDDREALARLFDHYLRAAAGAMDALYPAEASTRPHVAAPVAWSGPAAALAWLDAERATLPVVCGSAAARGFAGHTVRLAATVARHLDVAGHHADAIAIHTLAMAAGDRTDAVANLGLTHLSQSRYAEAAPLLESALDGYRVARDRAGEARVLRYLGLIGYRQGSYVEAVAHLTAALSLHERLLDHAGRARTLIVLGNVYWQHGRYALAADQYRQGLAVTRELGDRVAEAFALDNLGTVHERQGLLDEAADLHEQALAINREVGDRPSEACTLDNYGVVRRRQGRHRDAAALHERALAILREIGDPYAEAYALSHLAEVHLAQGEVDAAVAGHESALELFRSIGDRAGQAEVLNRLGSALASPDLHGSALTVATEIGDRYEQARALAGLGRRDEAAAIYVDLGIPAPGL